MPVTLRSATSADIPALMTLERQAATAAHWVQSDYDRLFDPAGPTRLCLVIEEAGRIEGFLVALRAGAEWELENVVVAEGVRHRGVASRLLKELLDRAKAHGAEAVFLEVRESNMPARLLYEKWAFVESGRRKQYYREPLEDAISYRLRLA